jgi:hypothetical protein
MIPKPSKNSGFLHGNIFRRKTIFVSALIFRTLIKAHQQIITKNQSQRPFYTIADEINKKH